MVITTAVSACQVSHAAIMGEMTTAVVIGELQPLVYSPHFGGQVRSLAEGSSSAQDHAAQEARSFESRISSSILVPGIARLATECLDRPWPSAATLSFQINPRPALSLTLLPLIALNICFLAPLPPLCQSSPRLFFISSLDWPLRRLPC